MKADSFPISKNIGTLLLAQSELIYVLTASEKEFIIAPLIETGNPG